LQRLVAGKIAEVNNQQLSPKNIALRLIFLSASRLPGLQRLVADKIARQTANN